MSKTLVKIIFKYVCFFFFFYFFVMHTLDLIFLYPQPKFKLLSINSQCSIIYIWNLGLLRQQKIIHTHTYHSYDRWFSTYEWTEICIFSFRSHIHSSFFFLLPINFGHIMFGRLIDQQRKQKKNPWIINYQISYVLLA